MSFQTWLKCIHSFEEGIKLDPCPNCGEKEIRYQFVGDESKNFGSLYLWCGSCMQGIHISSSRLPKGVDVLPFDAPKEEFARKIPDYKLIND